MPSPTALPGQAECRAPRTLRRDREAQTPTEPTTQRCPAPPGAAERHERQRERRQTLARTLHPLAAVRYECDGSHSTRDKATAGSAANYPPVLRSRSGPEVATLRWRQQERRRAFYRHGECRQRERLKAAAQTLSAFAAAARDTRPAMLPARPSCARSSHRAPRCCTSAPSSSCRARTSRSRGAPLQK
jgi:hypothetical protein